MHDNPLLGVIQKKGDRQVLSGKLIAYATVDVTDISKQNHQLFQLVRNGILAVQANYVDQRNIRDFFQAEFGVSLERGIQQIIDQAKENGGLEAALDPEAVREKMESMRNMEFIPIPAKISFFESEEELLAREEDIFYLGHFSNINHAQLSVNAFPILYQSQFREQEHRFISLEIESMLKEFENPQKLSPTANSNILNYTGDLGGHLLKVLIPKMLYSRDNAQLFAVAKTEFDTFMQGFGFPEDLQEIVNLVQSHPHESKKMEKLELLVEKVVALHEENFEQLDIIKHKIKGLS